VVCVDRYTQPSIFGRVSAVSSGMERQKALEAFSKWGKKDDEGFRDQCCYVSSPALRESFGEAI
jgi:hypothetical protein